MKKWKIKIEKLPPSKNLFYYGHSIKNAYIKYVREIPAVQELFNYFQNSKEYREIKITIDFFVHPSKYRKFEPQNYIETILDAFLGYNKDNYVKELTVRKHKSIDEYLLIEITEEQRYS